MQCKPYKSTLNGGAGETRFRTKSDNIYQNCGFLCIVQQTLAKTVVCCNLMKLISMLQAVGKLQQAGKGPVTRCNFSCNLQRYSTLGICKIDKYTFPSQFANIFLTYQTFVTNLHLLKVELRCKLPGKLHRVTGP